MQVARIASAFELERDAVLADGAIVASWDQDYQALLQYVQQLRGWDATITPYYVRWLTGTVEA
jgi:hypothetical protein